MRKCRTSTSRLELKLAVPAISANVPAGVYHVIVPVTDPSGATTAVDTGRTLVIQSPHVDPSGSFVKAPTIVKAGRQGSVQIVITNSGNIEASGRLTVSLSASQVQSLLGSTEVTASPPKTVHIKPGKSVKLQLKFPAGAAATSYFLIAQIDPDDVFHDDNLGKNVFATASKITVS